MLLFMHMKNSLLVPVVFISNLLVWGCLISFFSQLCSYETLQTLAARNYLPFFISLIGRFLYLVPFVVMFAILNVYLFLMRHKSIVFISVPLVLALTVLSVLFIIPFSYRLSDRFRLGIADVDIGQGTPDSNLHAAGYIRKYGGDNRVVWFDADEANNLVFPVITARDAPPSGETGLVIHPSARFSEESGSLTDGSEVLVENAAGKDPLLFASLGLPLYLESAAADTTRVLDAFHTAWTAGINGYLVRTGSFLVAITALWVLVYATGWRLLNMLLAVSGFRLLFAFFPFTLSGRLYKLVRRLLPVSVDGSLVSPLILASVSVLILFAGGIVLLFRLLSGRRREAYNE